MSEIIRCTKCNEILDSKKIIWLELSNTDGNFYKEIPSNHISQGGFPFGLKCSKNVLKDGSKRS
jgi:hypothetical protein